MNRLSVVCVVGLTILAGCAQRDAAVPEPVFDGALPTIAAQYRTQVREDGRTVQSVDWRLWRDVNRIEREDLQGGTGEIWQRDGATLFHSRLYHAHQRGIEYQPGDLGMLGASPHWMQQAWIVNPEVIRHLSLHSVRERQGVGYRRYTGEYAGADWDVTLRLDSMIPQSIERRQAERVERIELHEVHPLAAAPWQPTPSRDYGMIDFADLGDHERDPFVIGLQAHADGMGHGHRH